MKIYAFSLLLLFLYACSSTPDYNDQKSDASPSYVPGEKVQEILLLKDKRDAPGLLPYLIDTSSLIRAKAAWAFGSIQDTTILAQLLPLLGDPSPEVRKMTAFALGQLNYPGISADLIQYIQKEEDPEVGYYLAEALGKSASPEGLDFLISFKKEDPDWLPARVLGLHRAAMNGLSSEEGTEAIIHMIQVKSLTQKLVEQQDTPTLYLAANYLARLRIVPSDDQAKLLSLLFENDYWPTRVMASLILKEEKGKLKRQLLKEEKEEVIIALLRHINEKDEKILEKAWEWIKNPNLNLANAAANYLAQVVEKGDEDWLEMALALEYSQPKAALLRGLHPSQPEKISQILDSLFHQKDNNYYDKKAYAMAMRPDLPLLKSLYPSEDEKENEVLLEALLASMSSQELGANDLATFQEEIKFAIQSQNISQIYNVSNFLQRPGYQTFQKFIEEEKLIESALEKMTLPIDIESYWALQALQSKYAGEAFEPELPKFSNFIQSDALRKYPKHPILTFKTNRGDFKMELYPEHAPASVLLILKLVESGFYNDKTFHRVIPNFVAQGGCPLGNGFGGLEESIRSEFSTVNFGVGAVGLASAGKDTESCQFFICHVPTPHLDGKYTVFAQITEGMDKVYKLGIGDKIQEVILE